MVEIAQKYPPQLVDAVCCWTGWGKTAMPNRNDNRVLDRFGNEEGAVLLREIKTLEDDFYVSDAHLVAENMQDMAKRCADDFKRKRPEVPEEIVNAFVWCYTFDYK